MNKTVVANEKLNFGFSIQNVGTPFWSWFESHKDDTVITVGILFFKFKVTVGDLEGLFVKLFGANILGL